MGVSFIAPSLLLSPVPPLRLSLPSWLREFDVGLQDTRQPIGWLLRETRGQSGVVATCNIFSPEGLSVPLPTSTSCISLLQVVKKGAHPPPLTLSLSLSPPSLSAPYLPGHISTENNLKGTLKEGTVFIMCVCVKVGI